MHIVIGDIASDALSVEPSIKCEEVYSIFENDPSLEGIVVGVDNNPVGMICGQIFSKKFLLNMGSICL